MSCMLSSLDSRPKSVEPRHLLREITGLTLDLTPHNHNMRVAGPAISLLLRAVA